MPTDLIEIGPETPSEPAIHRAAELIRQGGIVAIPTDTLYALVCDPMNLHAVGQIFEAKGREASRALPLFVSDAMMAEELAREVTTRFFLLARRFWPGGLTIIVPASSKVPLKVTGNTGRLAVRQPKSEVPQALLEILGQPLVATSANLSGQPTCASGIEVFGAMDGRVDLVLDAGVISGTSATTVDITGPQWKVIREGAVPVRDIEEALRGT